MSKVSKRGKGKKNKKPPQKEKKENSKNQTVTVKKSNTNVWSNKVPLRTTSAPPESQTVEVKQKEIEPPIKKEKAKQNIQQQPQAKTSSSGQPPKYPRNQQTSGTQNGQNQINFYRNNKYKQGNNQRFNNKRGRNYQKKAPYYNRNNMNQKYRQPIPQNPSTFIPNFGYQPPAYVPPTQPTPSYYYQNNYPQYPQYQQPPYGNAPYVQPGFQAQPIITSQPPQRFQTYNTSNYNNGSTFKKIKFSVARPTTTSKIQIIDPKTKQEVDLKTEKKIESEEEKKKRLEEEEKKKKEEEERIRKEEEEERKRKEEEERKKKEEEERKKKEEEERKKKEEEERKKKEEEEKKKQEEEVEELINKNIMYFANRFGDRSNMIDRKFKKDCPEGKSYLNSLDAQADSEEQMVFHMEEEEQKRKLHKRERVYSIEFMMSLKDQFSEPPDNFDFPALDKTTDINMKRTHSYDNIAQRNNWRKKYKKRTNNWSAREVEMVKRGHDKLMLEVQLILNKITPEKYDKLKEDLIRLKIRESKTVEGMIGLLFEFAVNFPAFCDIYAKLIYELHSCERFYKHLEVEKEATTKTDYRSHFIKKTILNKCQKVFKDSFSTLKKDLSKMSEEEKFDHIAEKDKAVGNIFFIASFFQVKMLSEKIIHEIIRDLFKFIFGDDKTTIEPDKYEYISIMCKLIKKVGKLIKQKKYLDHYFRTFKRLTQMKLPKRFECLCLDVIDLKEKNNWIPKLKEDKAMKRKDIAKVFDEELGKFADKRVKKKGFNDKKWDNRDRRGGYGRKKYRGGGGKKKKK